MPNVFLLAEWNCEVKIIIDKNEFGLDYNFNIYKKNYFSHIDS